MVDEKGLAFAADDMARTTEVKRDCIISPLYFQLLFSGGQVKRDEDGVEMALVRMGGEWVASSTFTCAADLSAGDIVGAGSLPYSFIFYKLLIIG
ncbi:hypothetical protein GOBAR_AA27120 [Gossypium barbadense]|uniref:Uncharacterized protein n=1 Tax=Gossypium barbadense TaxID=3634 RepID=A0A2P5WR19_GOSBA|nr:hypothetical protein GOBAR_AA27120 [Gossypium barbadense]